MRKLPILCPQLYDGTIMLVTPCNRCDNWSRSLSSCQVYIGVEHLPLVISAAVPDCPIHHRCQHQIQTSPQPCEVRARGLVCESALREAGDPDPEGHPLSFHAMLMATSDEILERENCGKDQDEIVSVAQGR